MRNQSSPVARCPLNDVFARFESENYHTWRRGLCSTRVNNNMAGCSIFTNSTNTVSVGTARNTCINPTNNIRTKHRSRSRSLYGHSSHDTKKGTSQKRIQTVIIKFTARRNSERRHDHRRHLNPSKVAQDYAQTDDNGWRSQKQWPYQAIGRAIAFGLIQRILVAVKNFGPCPLKSLIFKRILLSHALVVRPHLSVCKSPE